MDKFVITIARQYGSGGRTVGQMLAEKLGVEYYDKDLIIKASEESGINLDLLPARTKEARASLTVLRKRTTAAKFFRTLTRILIPRRTSLTTRPRLSETLLTRSPVSL